MIDNLEIILTLLFGFAAMLAVEFDTQSKINRIQMQFIMCEKHRERILQHNEEF